MAPTISTLIHSAEGGELAAAQTLFAALYSELHRLAERQMARGGGGVTLGTTSLLHEAYLRLCQREGARFPDRGRFMAYAARVMRGLVVDYARRRRAHKRGGQFEITALVEDEIGGEVKSQELSRLSDALDELAAVDPELAQVVDLKFFCGFSFVEIAALQGVSDRTIQRNWDKARIFLHRGLGGEVLR